MSYIDGEFARLGDLAASEYRPQIKVTSVHGETKWLRVDPATVAEIHALLKRDEEKEGA